MSPARKLVQAALLFVAAAAYSGTPATAFSETCEDRRSSCHDDGGTFWFHGCDPSNNQCGEYSCGSGDLPGVIFSCCWDMPIGSCS
jgi:hypothetical protein